MAENPLGLKTVWGNGCGALGKLTRLSVQGSSLACLSAQRVSSLLSKTGAIFGGSHQGDEATTRKYEVFRVAGQEALIQKQNREMVSGVKSVEGTIFLKLHNHRPKLPREVCISI
jgi:hypothetical protein